MKNKDLLKKLIGTSIVCALEVVFILVGGIRLGVFTITLALIPICIGSILYGKFAGLFLGLFMGLFYLLDGEASAFLSVEPVGTVILMLAKSGLAGFFSGLIYELISKKDNVLAIWCSSLVCPIINSGLFILLTALFLSSLAEGSNPIVYVATTFVGVNFFIELLISIVLTPTIIYLIKIANKAIKRE